MKKIIIFIVIILILVLGYMFYFKNSAYQTPKNAQSGQVESPTKGAPTTPEINTSVKKVAKTYPVSITNFSFSPNTITIEKGDSIIWTNNDSAPHQISANNSEGNVIKKGEVYSYTFVDAGIINYICAIHPNMKGTIIVK